MQALSTPGPSRRTGLLVGLCVFALVAVLSALGLLGPSDDALLALLASLLPEGLATHSLMRAPVWAQYALLLAFALLEGWWAGRGDPLARLLATLGALALLFALGFSLLLARVHLPLMAPLLATTLTGGLLIADVAAQADHRRTEAETRLQSRLATIRASAGSRLQPRTRSTARRDLQ